MAVLLKTTVDGTLSLEKSNSEAKFIINNNSPSILETNATTVNAFNNQSFVRFGSTSKESLITINTSNYSISPNFTFYNYGNGQTNSILSRINFSMGGTKSARIDTIAGLDATSVHFSFKISAPGQNEIEAMKTGDYVGNTSSSSGFWYPSVTTINNTAKMKTFTLKTSGDVTIDVNSDTGQNGVTFINGRLVVYVYSYITACF